MSAPTRALALEAESENLTKLLGEVR